MPTRVITPVSVEPITLAEAKAHLRVDFLDDDAYITALISVARDYAEGFQKRSLATQTLELTLNNFVSIMHLQRGPVQSVTSVKYTPAGGTPVTLLPEAYQLTTSGEIYPVPSSWPCVGLIPAEGVQVRYVAGYTILPPATKQAILLLMGHWYENRETVTMGRTPVEVPFAATSLLWLDRAW